MNFFRSGRTFRLLSLTLLVAGVAITVPSLAEESSSTVEKCSRNFGSIAVSEPQGQSLSRLSGYGLGSPVAVLRMMIQQSGCFSVVERGVAMQNIQQERALAQAGEMRAGTNIGKGQMQAADFVMTPNVLFSQNTGGMAGGLTSWGRGGILGAVGGLAGGLKFKEAQTSLLVADVRSSIQVAAAEGSAKKTDFGVGGWGYGGSSIGGLGGYTSTPEGKMIAASLLDNYNKVVIAIRDQSSLIRTSNESSNANAAASTQAGVPVNAGDMLRPKINNVRIFAQPSNTSKVLGTIQKNDELVATGEDKGGFIKVDAAQISGWVQKTLVMLGTGASLASGSPAPAIIPVSANPMQSAISAGSYSGSYVGAENGVFHVAITANGAIIGSGKSSTFSSRFEISGSLDNNNGVLNMTATGKSGAASFSGSLDPGTGRINGSWRYNDNNSGGSFQAQKI